MVPNRNLDAADGGREEPGNIVLALLPVGLIAERVLLLY